MIHKYKLNGVNIVLDVNSGSIHIVDELTYDLLEHIEPPFEDKCPQDVQSKLSKVYHFEDIQSCYNEIVELYNDKILFSKHDYEKYTKYSISSHIKAICLNVSHDCQLRCKYCFASTGDFGNGRQLMSLKTAKHAIDFLLKNSGDRQNLELDFFGGEPLMNFNVIKQAVEYARVRETEFEKKFRFTITTNGLLLDDEKIDFINHEMDNVVLSIDGRKQVNDYFRVFPNNIGCYDIILPKYQQLVAGRGDKEYYVRGTFTKKNLDFSKDVFALYNAGFDQISIEPVTCCDEDEYALTKNELPIIFEEYENLAKHILESEKNGKKLNFFHFMIDIDNDPCVIKRLRGCGCGNDYIAIIPNGDIFPCHQFVGIDKYKMGNIIYGIFDSEMKSNFANCHIYSKYECRNCWAKFYCTGGCNANNFKYMGDIHSSYKIFCELEKKRLECAIMLKAVKTLA